MFDETIATMLLLPLPCRWIGRPVLLLRLLRQNLETMSVTKQVAVVAVIVTIALVTSVHRLQSLVSCRLSLVEVTRRC